MKQNEIVVLGFPKCGTGSLMGALIRTGKTEILRDGKNLEVAWPAIKGIRTVPSKPVVAHKFAAYIYKKEALDYLAKSNPESIVVLCVRDPLKVLVSWHNMRRSIAKNGPTNHPAYKDREFLLNCSVADFYWAKKMENFLKYDLHFSTLRKFFDDERIVVVSQERMAQDIDAVAAWIVELAMSPLGTIVEAPKPDTSVKPHVGYADKAKTILDDDIATTLTKTKKSLFGLIEGSSVRTLL